MLTPTKEWCDVIYTDTSLTDTSLTIEHVQDVLSLPFILDAVKFHGLNRFQTVDRLMPVQSIRNKDRTSFSLLTKRISEFVDIKQKVYTDATCCLCFLGIVPVELVEGLSSTATPSEFLMVISSNYFRIKHERYRARQFFYEFAIADYSERPGVGDDIKELIHTRQRQQVTIPEENARLRVLVPKITQTGFACDLSLHTSNNVEVGISEVDENTYDIVSIDVKECTEQRKSGIPSTQLQYKAGEWCAVSYYGGSNIVSYRFDGPDQHNKFSSFIKQYLNDHNTESSKPIQYKQPTNVLLVPEVAVEALSRDLNMRQMLDLLTPTTDGECTFLTHIERVAEVFLTKNTVWTDHDSCLCALGVIPVRFTEGIGLAPTSTDFMVGVAANYWLEFIYRNDEYVPEYAYELAIRDYIEKPGVKNAMAKFIKSRTE